MRIIFVYRLPAGFERNSVIDSQAEALEKAGAVIIRYAIKKGGLKGYIKSILELYKLFRTIGYDIVHAHYFQSALAAMLARPKKIAVSLMGSDINEAGTLQLLMIRFLSRFAWHLTIVKSAMMQAKVPRALIIPNGVDFEIFRPMDKVECLKDVGFDPGIKNLIFVSEDISSQNKNFELAEKAVTLTGRKDIRLIPVTRVHQSRLVYYYNAADAMLFTSKKEGSPNVVKEAMACNCPIIATPAGDVPELLKDTVGTFVVQPDPGAISDKIDEILAMDSRTNGREKLQHLDSKAISRQIIREYERILSKKSHDCYH